jgi:hypothetical protein
MVILTDDQSNPTMQPTRSNIIRAMGWLVSNAQPNDALFLHYSGRSHPFVTECVSSNFVRPRRTGRRRGR